MIFPLGGFSSFFIWIPPVVHLSNESSREVGFLYKRIFDIYQKCLDLREQFQLLFARRNRLRRVFYLHKPSNIRVRRIFFLHSRILSGLFCFNNAVLPHEASKINYLNHQLIQIYDRDGLKDNWGQRPQFFQGRLQGKEAFHELPLFRIYIGHFYHINQMFSIKNGVKRKANNQNGGC